MQVSTYDGFLRSLRSSVHERTSIDAKVSINHALFSVFNAGFLCACDTGLLRSYRVICVQCGFSMQLLGLLQSIRVFSVANGFSV